MDILTRLNEAIDFIEKNLTSVIDYERIALICYCSSYNFHRMFTFITGISVSEYVKRRRMTMAAFDLKAGSKVIETALKFGYESPVSFARAFRSVHQVSPAEVKKGSSNLKAYPKMTFQIQIKGVSEMNYRFEEKPKFMVFGVERKILYDGDSMQIPNFFIECIQDGTYDAIKRLGKERYPYNNQPTISGINMNNEEKSIGFSYYVGWLVFDDNPAPDQYKTVEIPSGTWAVFESERYTDGTNDVSIIQSLWQRIFSEWLPISDYDLADLPQIEQDYYDDTNACYVAIWIPVKKKQKDYPDFCDRLME